MNSETAIMRRAQALVKRLARLPPETDPTIDRLLNECPELGDSDWINRHGTWEEIANHYSTAVIEWLIRVLVTAERELRWGTNSVAATIWLFRIYHDRSDGDAEGLANWVVRNRGNDYVPFGSMGLRSFAEWRDRRLRPVETAEARAEREAEAAQEIAGARAERALIRQQEAHERIAASQIRTRLLHDLFQEIKAMTPGERLAHIARNTVVPLEAIPLALLDYELEVMASLDTNTRMLLRARIDRRNRGVWGAIKKRLDQLSLLDHALQTIASLDRDTRSLLFVRLGRQGLLNHQIEPG